MRVREQVDIHVAFWAIFLPMALGVIYAALHGIEGPDFTAFTTYGIVPVENDK